MEKWGIGILAGAHPPYALPNVSPIYQIDSATGMFSIVPNYELYALALCLGPLHCRTGAGKCCPLVFNGLRWQCPYIC